VCLFGGLTLFIIFFVSIYSLELISVILIMITMLIGVIGYVFSVIMSYRPKVERLVSELQDVLKFCIQCGTSLDLDMKGLCPKCGFEFPFVELLE